MLPNFYYHQINLHLGISIFEQIFFSLFSELWIFLKLSEIILWEYRLFWGNLYTWEFDISPANWKKDVKFVSKMVCKFLENSHFYL